MVADAVAVALVALGLFIAFRGGFPSNDSWHALIWAEELASGRLPDYEAPLAPTPHPLMILYAAALSPFGPAADPVLQVTAMAALSAVAVGVFRLGTRLYAWPVGLLAAATLLTREQFLYLGVRGTVDVLALALIVWAAVLEAQRSPRGWPVLALLFLAGLLRPEAWLFGAAYWLWLIPARGWRASAGLGALAGAAPMLWALTDYLVTGDPLWSLRGTQALAETLDRPTGVSALPASAWYALEELLTPPLAIVGACGLVAGLVFRRRPTLLLAAILALGATAFVGLALFSLPLNERYLTPAAFVLILGSAVSALGWVTLPSRTTLRSVWRAAGALTAVFMAVLLHYQLPTLASLRADIVANQAIGNDLRALLDSDSVRREVLHCGRLVAPSNFRRPQLAYLANRSEESVALPKRGGLRKGGVYVRAATESEATSPGNANSFAPTDFRAFSRDIGPLKALVPQGYSELARTRFWVAYSRCEARSGRNGRSGRQVPRAGGERTP